MVPNAPKWYETHQNMSGSNGVDRVLSLRKIPMRLRGTKFCTSSDRFAPSFLRQPNRPKCTQMVRNSPKHEFRVQWSGSGAFVAKISNATSSARFEPSFVRQPNGHECTQIVQNARKHQFTVQWGGSNAFNAKNSDATSCQKLLHYFGLFCTEFRKATKRSRMHPNSTKRTKISV